MKIIIPVFIALLTIGTQVRAADIQYDIKVDGITCPFCVATSRKALSKIDGVRSVSANLKTGIISVCGADTLEFNDAQLIHLFREKGFTYRHITKKSTCNASGQTAETSNTNEHKH